MNKQKEEYTVYFDQINGRAIIVLAANSEEAEKKALKEWRKICKEETHYGPE